jgi:hypothetical protein
VVLGDGKTLSGDRGAIVGLFTRPPAWCPDHSFASHPSDTSPRSQGRPVQAPEMRSDTLPLPIAFPRPGDALGAFNAHTVTMATPELCPSAGLNRAVSENLIKNRDCRERVFSNLGSCN